MTTSELTMSRAKDLKRVDRVVEWRLCAGCGACIPACPNQALTLVNMHHRGLRPVVDPEKCRKCGECVGVCPGIEISHPACNGQAMPELREEWGPVLEVWEGHATDPEIRHYGSSGGLATALALYCLENRGMSGVLHVGAREGDCVENVAVFSKNRADMLARTGSRYSPAAPCEKLQWIQEADSPSVFIGKPCDVVALRKSQAINPMLDEKVGLAIGIFCAGTPATDGTYRVLKALGVEPQEAQELRYRGCGWPGMTTVKVKGDNGRTRQMTYEESWSGILSKCRQFRCTLCPDTTGEFADLSCGDPWYREIEPGEQGLSLVLVRSETGREILHEAQKAGYVELERAEPCRVPQSQKSMLSHRRRLWGRLSMMRLMRIPLPSYKGFSMFRNWLKLSTVQKMRSLAGALKRIISGRLTRPLKPITKPHEMHQTDDAQGPRVDSDEFGVRCKA